MAIAQISARKSLRDVVSNIGAQRQQIYHLGMRSTREQPWHVSMNNSPTRKKHTEVCIHTEPDR
jgi:hypothetical protein